MSIGTVLLIVFIVALLGGFHGYTYPERRWPTAAVVIVMIALLLLFSDGHPILR